MSVLSETRAERAEVGLDVGASPSPSAPTGPRGAAASMERRIGLTFTTHPIKQLNSSSEPSFTDCNRRKPGGILGAGQHLGWEMR
jgi:hypothetical protein